MLNKMMSDLKKPDNRYRGIPFWSWNDRMEEEELGWVDISCMPEVGYGLPISEVNGCSTLKHVLMKAIRLVSNFNRKH